MRFRTQSFVAVIAICCCQSLSAGVFDSAAPPEVNLVFGGFKARVTRLDPNFSPTHVANSGAAATGRISESTEPPASKAVWWRRGEGTRKIDGFTTGLS